MKWQLVAESVFKRYGLAIGLYFSSVIVFSVGEWKTAGKLGFPFDDSWIFAQYARNLANGYGFCFNIGEPSSGFTSFLWLLLCATAYKLTGEFVLPMKFMGILFGAGCVVVAHQLVDVLTNDERKAKWGAYMTALFAPLVANSLAGMEGSLYAFTALTGIYLHLRWQRQPSWYWLLEGLWWGIAILARPENLIFYAIVVADKIWQFRTYWKKVLIWLILQMLLVAAIMFPWVVVNLSTTGTPFTGTYLAKVLPARKVFYGHWGLAIGFPIALIQGWVSWTFYSFALFPTLVVLLVWQHFNKMRYQFGTANLPNKWLLIFAALVTGVQAIQFPLGTWTIWSGWGRYLLPTYLMAGLSFVTALKSMRWVLLVMLLGMLPSYKVVMSEYAQGVKVTERLNVRFGKWLRENTQPSDIIATHDIGAIGFFSQRQIFDTQGLIHADVALRLTELWDDNKMLNELRSRKVSYLAVADTWRLAKMRPDLFELLLAEEGWNFDVSRRFCIYRIHWEQMEKPNP
ncbi:MAG: hypothetical protein NZ937_03390 [Armatimonadetes bacterium]|nr:hypothetical protein [Armatimonadota bacterium]